MFNITDWLKRRKIWLLGVSVLCLTWAWTYFRKRKEHQESVERKRLLVFFQGAPGLGKTTLARPVAAKLNSRGIKSKSIEQDTFAANGRIKNSGRRFTNYLDKLMRTRRFDVILSARNNATPDQYQHHAKLAEMRGWSCVWLYPSYLDTNSDQIKRLFALMVLHSLFQRSEAVRLKKARPHPTFAYLQLERKLHICGNFLVRLKRPSDLPVIPISWLRPVLDPHFPKDVTLRNVESFLEHIRVNGWQGVPMAEDEVCSSLRLREVNWSQQLRTPLSDLVEEVTEAIYRHYKK